MTTQSQLETLSLTAVDLKAMTDWPDSLILDYLSILENFNLISGLTDTNIEDIDDNTDSIDKIEEEVEDLTTKVDDNTGAIEELQGRQDISFNKLKSGISINKKGIVGLLQIISTLSAQNSILRGRLNRSVDDHNNLVQSVASS